MPCVDARVDESDAHRLGMGCALGGWGPHSYKESPSLRPQVPRCPTPGKCGCSRRSLADRACATALSALRVDMPCGAERTTSVVSSPSSSCRRATVNPASMARVSAASVGSNATTCRRRTGAPVGSASITSRFSRMSARTRVSRRVRRTCGSSRFSGRSSVCSTAPPTGGRFGTCTWRQRHLGAQRRRAGQCQRAR